MGMSQPAEVIGDLAVGPGPDDEMPVVGQDAVRQNAERMPAMGLDHDPAKRLEVVVVTEQPHPPDCTVQDVVDPASRCFGACPWHRNKSIPARRLQVNLAASPFLLRPKIRLAGRRLLGFDAMMLGISA